MQWHSIPKPTGDPSWDRRSIVRRFAWLPVRVLGYRRVWLEFYLEVEGFNNDDIEDDREIYGGDVLPAWTDRSGPKPRAVIGRFTMLDYDRAMMCWNTGYP